MTAAANGVRPVVNLNDLLGDRAKERDVILGEHTYVFRPLNLFTAKLLDEGKIEEAFRNLILGDEIEVEAFMAACPAADLATVVQNIYGVGNVESSVPPPTGSAPEKAASKPSKRTSSRGRSR